MIDIETLAPTATPAVHAPPAPHTAPIDPPVNPFAATSPDAGADLLKVAQARAQRRVAPQPAEPTAAAASPAAAPARAAHPFD